MPLVVFTGGARSGKSSAAQHLAHLRSLQTGAGVRVVVFGRDDGLDAEFGERIARHRASRPASWETVECRSSEQLETALDFHGVVLIDCVGTLLGLVMEEAFAEGSGSLAEAPAEAVPAGYEEAVEQRFGALLESIRGREADTVVVSNEVGDGLVPLHATGRLFRDLMGRANRALVSSAQTSYACVCGRLIDLTALPEQSHWPTD